MAEKTKQRTEKMQQALESEYNGEMQKLEEQINQCIQKHDGQITKVQQEHLEELRNLIKEKLRLEEEIIKTTNELGDSYEKTKEVLKVILDGRIQECNEGLAELKKVANDDGWEEVEESQEL